MEILVCIKQVPDVPTIRIDRRRMTIIREGVESIINPLDDVALEAALDLRAREGGRVRVMTMGPPQSEAALREAVAMGADQGFLLSDPAFAGADTLATSHVLARAVSLLKPFPDLIMCGMQTIDSDTGQVGPQLAEELDLPQICGVIDIRVQGRTLRAMRLSDGFLDTMETVLPALVTVGQGLHPVSDLSLGALERAFSEKDIVRWGLDDLGLPPGEVGLEGSATRVRRLYPPRPRRRGECVSGSPETLVDRFIRELESLSILGEEHGGE